MKPVIIDTDILSEFFRGNKMVTIKMEEYLAKHNEVNISIITYYEILNGLLYKDAKKQMQKFNSFVELNNLISLTKKSVQISANIQAVLRSKGIDIGHTDILIAGTALENNLKLITNNINHFARIKELEIETWIK